jgi:arylsulfatase A-like enzyme
VKPKFPYFHSIFQVFLAVIMIGVSHGANKTNVVFILIDGLGWSDTTLYGTTQFYQTPNLERLAKRGMLFSRAYAGGLVDCPTRASILTGLSPSRLGITLDTCGFADNILESSLQKQAPATQKLLLATSATRLDTKYVTIAETLKAAGYKTAHFGKWHLGPRSHAPLYHGFDVDIPNTFRFAPGKTSYFAPWALDGFLEKVPNEHIDDRITNEAVTWMEKNKDEPFFLNYCPFSMRAPYSAKPELIGKYKTLANPASSQRSPTYAAMVETMDTNIGKLLDALDRLGIADRTGIVFYSTHGGQASTVGNPAIGEMVDGGRPTSNSPLRGGAWGVYEGGLAVPCVVSWPNLTKPGSRSDAVIQSMDFYPTLLELLDLKPEPDQVFDGISIAKALTGKPLTRQAIFVHFPHYSRFYPKDPDSLPPSTTVISDGWKLIRIYNDDPKGSRSHRLYHIKEDIGEINNLASTSDLATKEPQKVKLLEAMIENHLAMTKAIVPKANPAYGTKPNPAAK